MLDKGPTFILFRCSPPRADADSRNLRGRRRRWRSGRLPLVLGRQLSSVTGTGLSENVWILPSSVPALARFGGGLDHIFHFLALCRLTEKEQGWLPSHIYACDRLTVESPGWDLALVLVFQGPHLALRCGWYIFLFQG